MFLFKNINSLSNWNVSKGKNFSGMFNECSSLHDIDGLKNWNISNGNNFMYMFSGCTNLNRNKIPSNLRNKI